MTGEAGPCVAATESGDVSGWRTSSGCVFRGIPFAAPPVGAQRHGPPRPVPRWDGVRPAVRFANVCAQSPPPAGAGPSRALATFGARSEDCLYLNVWTPAADDGARPVMVWIHGGSFEVGAGSDPLYDGSSFARDDVVLVTVNYRLNAFGFLNLAGDFDGADATGYLGILDQVAALQWVQQNISRFGGDPGNVTVFGESAGGMSIGILLSMPATHGLFGRAILQSGAGHHALKFENSKTVARRVLRTLDVRPGDWDRLREVPAQRLLAAAEEVMHADMALLLGDQAQSRMPFQPTAPGGLPTEILARGGGNPVDVIVGTCADEWRLFTWEEPADPPGWQPSRVLLARSLPGGTGTVDRLVRTYSALSPGLGEQDVLARIEEDLMFTVPARRLAQAVLARGRTARMYRFGWGTPVHSLGACHNLDVPFVFETLEAAADLAGPNPPAGLARRMHEAWVSFARDGAVPGWPACDPASERVMEFAGDSPGRAPERDLEMWHGLA